MLNSLNVRDEMQMILCAVILITAYCISLGLIAGRIQNRGAFPLAAAVLFCIFGCAGVMLFFLYEITGESDILLIMLLLIFSVTGLGGELWFVIRHKKDLNKNSAALLLVYVLAILLVTLFLRQGGTDNRIEMQLFSGVGENFHKHSEKILWHMLQNVALFVPAGLLFPMIHHSFSRLSYTVLNGLMFSIWIETTQMITASGTCDINDILANTLGAALGYGIFRICKGKQR